MPPAAVLCRVLPRFHGAFIVRFTALSPSSQKSGDTVTFVNKDRMPGGRCCHDAKGWENPMICFRASWLRTALAVAVVTTTIPARALAQTTPAILDTTSAQTGSPTTSPVSSGAVGSGSSGPTAPDDFYFRAGAVLDWPKETRFKDQDCSSSSPAALYGCGNGIDGAPLSSLGDFEARAGFELGVGYAAAPALRLEAVLQYRPNFSFEGRANFIQTTGRQAVSADLSSLSGLLVAYLDLPGRSYSPESPGVPAPVRARSSGRSAPL